MRVGTDEEKNGLDQQWTQTTNTYEFGDEARIKGTTYTATVVDAPDVANNNVYRYDANGYLNSVAVNDERARTGLDQTRSR